LKKVKIEKYPHCGIESVESRIYLYAATPVNRGGFQQKTINKIIRNSY